MSVKIAIISDTHFGFGRNTERFEDSWEGGEEAFEKAKNCDVIILPGDIFDRRIPHPEEWSKAMEILSKVKAPIVAIHGNHERRGKELINPVEGLERAGFLKYLHCNSVTLDVKGKKIAIYGMGWVPDIYAKEVLQSCNPQPIKRAYNIFVLHQSIGSYVFSSIEPPSLNLDDLPKGFDLYICGHVHWSARNKVHGKPFLIPGSTVTTQINKSEAKNPKGFYIVELSDGREDIKFVKLKNARKVFYNEFEINHDKISEINEKIESYLDGINENKKPLVRVVVKGKIGKGPKPDFFYLRGKYRKKLILSIGLKVSEEDVEEKIKILRDARNKRMSIEEIGMKILRENMKEMKSSMDYDELFELLVNGNVDSAMTYLLSEMKKPEKSVEEKRKTGLQRWLE